MPRHLIKSTNEEFLFCHVISIKHESKFLRNRAFVVDWYEKTNWPISSPSLNPKDPDDNQSTLPFLYRFIYLYIDVITSTLDHSMVSFTLFFMFLSTSLCFSFYLNIFTESYMQPKSLICVSSHPVVPISNRFDDINRWGCVFHIGVFSLIPTFHLTRWWLDHGMSINSVIMLSPCR